MSTTRRAHARKGTRGVRAHPMRVMPPTERGEWTAEELRAYLRAARHAEDDIISGLDDVFVNAPPTRAEIQEELRAGVDSEEDGRAYRVRRAWNSNNEGL